MNHRLGDHHDQLQGPASLPTKTPPTLTRRRRPPDYPAPFTAAPRDEEARPPRPADDDHEAIRPRSSMQDTHRRAHQLDAHSTPIAQPPQSHGEQDRGVPERSGALRRMGLTSSARVPAPTPHTPPPTTGRTRTPQPLPRQTPTPASTPTNASRLRVCLQGQTPPVTRTTGHHDAAGPNQHQPRPRDSTTPTATTHNVLTAIDDFPALERQGDRLRRTTTATTEATARDATEAQHAARLTTHNTAAATQKSTEITPTTRPTQDRRSAIHAHRSTATADASEDLKAAPATTHDLASLGEQQDNAPSPAAHRTGGAPYMPHRPLQHRTCTTPATPRPRLHDGSHGKAKSLADNAENASTTSWRTTAPPRGCGTECATYSFHCPPTIR